MGLSTSTTNLNCVIVVSSSSVKNVAVCHQLLLTVVRRDGDGEIGQMFDDSFERRFATNNFRRHGRRRRRAAQVWNSERLARRARHATKDFGPALAVDAEKKI